MCGILETLFLKITPEKADFWSKISEKQREIKINVFKGEPIARKMQKILSLLLAMIIGLAGCGKTTLPVSGSTKPIFTEEETEANGDS